MLSGRRHGSKAGSGTVEKAWLGKDDAAWGDAVESWKWLEIGDEEWEKSGLCPRCEHGMKVEQSGAWVGLPAGAGEPRALGLTTTATSTRAATAARSIPADRRRSRADADAGA